MQADQHGGRGGHLVRMHSGEVGVCQAVVHGSSCFRETHIWGNCPNDHNFYRRAPAFNMAMMVCRLSLKVLCKYLVVCFHVLSRPGVKL